MFGLMEKIMSGIIVALLFALAGMWWYCSISTNTLKDQLDVANNKAEEAYGKIGELTAQVAILKAGQARLSGALEKQTEAVTVLEEKQVSVTKAATEAVKAEKKRASVWQGKYAAILNAPAKGTACENLASKMTDYYLERQREEGAAP